MKKLLVFFLSVPLWAALSVPITVKESVYTNGFTTGIARTNEPFCQGVPIADSANITSINVLGLTGATAGQFRILGSWPSGHAKWIKVCGIVASVSAGGTASVTLTDTGSGNFPAGNLASDPGGSSPFVVSTGTATFTIKKANFNLLDTAVVGSTTIISTGSATGVTIMGPSVTATFPDNVTCSTDGANHAGVSSICNNLYSSSNDTQSSGSIEENGPVMCTIFSQGTYKDASGNRYFAFNVRQTFYRNKNYDSIKVIDKNALYTNTNSFNSAYKGMLSHEIRLAPTYANANALNVQISTAVAPGTCGASGECATTVTQGGSDFAYIYAGQSTFKHLSNTYITSVPAWENLITTDSGYSIYKNASLLETGNSSIWPVGWADVGDSTGQGIQFGVRDFAAYYAKSLEVNSGGSRLTIGLWASENGNPSGGPGAGTNYHYQAWPEAEIFEAYLNFHTTALTATTASNAFLSWQHNLVAYPTTYSYANTTLAMGGTGIWPLTDPAAEDTFYASLVTKMKPKFNSSGISTADFGVNVNDPFHYLNAIIYNSWDTGGTGNQMDYGWSHLVNFFRRGHDGEYLQSLNWGKVVMEKWMPRLDGDMWKNHTGDIDQQGFPVLFTPQNYSKVYSSGSQGDRAGMEHRISRGGGLIDLYYISGDETVKDYINQVLLDFYSNTWSGLYPNKGGYINDRSIGSHLSIAGRLYTFLNDQGDPTNAATVKSIGQTVYDKQVKPDLCVNGYPTGCTTSGTSTLNASGLSRVRGMLYGTYQNVTSPEGLGNLGPGSNDCVGSVTSRGASNNVVGGVAAFKQSMWQNGMWEFRAAMGSNWANYTESLDLMYLNAQYALTDGYNDDGSGSYGSMGQRYYLALDFANNVPAPCYIDGARFYAGRTIDTVWVPYFTQNQYNGSVTSWKNKLVAQMQKNIADGTIGDFGHYLNSAAVQAMITTPSQSLVTVNNLSVGPYTAGNYNVTFDAPLGATSYRIKCATSNALTLVEWIGFNPGTYQWAIPSRTPQSYQNWGAATEVTGFSVPGGTRPTVVVPASSCGGQTNLTTPNFMVKAWASFPTGQLVQVKTHGVPVADPGNPSGIKFNPDLSKTLLWGNYHDTNSEVNNGMFAYDYEMNYWYLLDRTDCYADEHHSECGHPDSQWPEYDTLDQIHLGLGGGGSGTSGLEAYYLPYAYNFGGQVWFQKFPILRMGRTSDTPAIWDQTLNNLVMASTSVNGWYNFNVAADSNHSAPNLWTGKASSPLQTNNGACWVFNSDDGNIYSVFGTNGNGNAPQIFNTIYKYSTTLNTWTLITPNNSPPAPRGGGACDYDTKAKKIYYWGGKNSVKAASDGVLAYQELWSFDPVTLLFLNETPPSPLPVTLDGFIMIGSHLVYDAIHNIHILENGPAVTNVSFPYLDDTTYSGDNVTETWIFRSIGSGPSPGITEVQAVNPLQINPTIYAPSQSSLNRNTAGWAQRPTLAVSQDGTKLALARSELSNPFLHSNPAQSPVPYVDIFDFNTGVWTKADSGNANAYQAYVTGACASGYGAQWYRPQISFAGGVWWLGYYGTQGQNRKTFMQQGNLTSIPTSWNPNCGSPQQITLNNNSAQGAALLSQAIDVGGTPYISIKEGRVSSFNFQWINVMHWNGSAWVYDVSSGLNISSTSMVMSHQMFKDGSGNACVGWTEMVGVGGANYDYTTYQVPQIYVKCLIASVWTQQGAGSLNSVATNFATYPTFTTMGGTIYGAWTERTNAGTNQLIVRKLSAGAWSTVGVSSLNQDTANGWAFAPSITNDGTNLFVAWTEGTYQHQKGSFEPPCSTCGPGGSGLISQFRPKGWLAKFPPGGPWAIQGGGPFNADAIYGAMDNAVAVVYNGKPTVAFVEKNWGAPQQVYVKTLSGGAFTSLGTQGLTCTVGTLPGTTLTASYNQSVASWASGGTGAYSFTITSGALPTGLSLAVGPSGSITGTVGGVAGTSTFIVSVTDATPTTVACGQASIVTHVAPSITTTTLAGGTTGTPYNQPVLGTNGTTPYTWAISAGALPTGLAIGNTTGTITGTPTAAGTFNFTVRLTDAASVTATKALSIVIVGSCVKPTITTTSPLPQAAQGTSYGTVQFAATGDLGGICSGCTWSATGVPTGMTLSSTGGLSGTPTGSGTATLQVTATNSCGTQTGAPTAFSLTIIASNKRGGVTHKGGTSHSGNATSK